jgi:tRNA (cmo5U34)-methyltransferase
MMNDRSRIPVPENEDRFGHHWTEPERVREYVERTDRESAERTDAFTIMVGVVPFDRTDSFRVLDIGAGHGAVAAVVLEAFPNAEAVGLDVSEPMMEVGRERMARFGGRFSYHVGDFADGELPGDLPGPFDVAVASRAIHHLPADQKRSLYRAVFQALRPGGAVFNLDTMQPSDPELKALYRQAGDALRGRPIDRVAARVPRPPSPSHYFESVQEHLGFLSQAGFAPVDCFWKRLGNALIGGYKPA